IFGAPVGDRPAIESGASITGTVGANRRLAAKSLIEASFDAVGASLGQSLVVREAFVFGAGRLPDSAGFADDADVADAGVRILRGCVFDQLAGAVHRRGAAGGRLGRRLLAGKADFAEVHRLRRRRGAGYRDVRPLRTLFGVVAGVDRGVREQRRVKLGGARPVEASSAGYRPTYAIRQTRPVAVRNVAEPAAP